MTDQASGQLPKRDGLYDSRFEHDACGVGFVCNISARRSHKIVTDGLLLLENLTHRGGCGCDAESGDGAGILTQMPHAFFKSVCTAENIDLPPENTYGAGMIFFAVFCLVFPALITFFTSLNL